VSVGLSVCLSVCLSVFPHDISKTNAVRITKLDIDMAHRQSWKRIYFGVRRSKVKVMMHEKAFPAWVLALL